MLRVLKEPGVISPRVVLTLNAGSSSIRFALHAVGERLQPKLRGKVDRIGLAGTLLQVDASAGHAGQERRMVAASHAAATDFLLGWLEGQSLFAAVFAAGHRVVHGMHHALPVRVTPGLLAELRRMTPYDPEHLPREIGLIQALRKRFPKLPQVACFDTAFHRSMPDVARRLPLPRRFAAFGLERYGFHGLSYAYLMETLERINPAEARGRVILAHLGNGASMAAVRNGKSMDTSMGFTPTSGLVMGTRTGDMDPGVMYYLARTRRMSPTQLQALVNQQSGLLGVSGTSPDMRDLLARAPRDKRAAEAVALFCYQARKWVGAYAATLGGLDTLVFTGGIGENAPAVRAQVCAGLEFLGIRLSATRNAKNAAMISTSGSHVNVRVIHTDEESMIARSVIRLLLPRAGAGRAT